tara:strand:- start:1836 stop:4127 length:2292 start_codon:yes stop_codon:yes gene_type:complete
MAAEQVILQLAEEFLKTSKGKKILGKEIPTQEINRQIEEIAQRAELTESELMNLGYVTAAKNGIAQAKQLQEQFDLPEEELKIVGTQYANNAGLPVSELTEEELVEFGREQFLAFASDQTDSIDFANINVPELKNIALEFPNLDFDFDLSFGGGGLSKEERRARRQRRKDRRAARRDARRQAREEAKAEIRALIRKRRQEYTPTLKTFVISGKVFAEPLEIFDKWEAIDKDQTLSESEKRKRKLEVTTSETDGSFGGVRIGAAYLKAPDASNPTINEQLDGILEVPSPDPDYTFENPTLKDVAPKVPDVREINPLDTVEGAEYVPYPNSLILPPYRSDGSKFMDISLFTLKLENLSSEEIQNLTPEERRALRREERRGIRDARREERNELKRIDFEATTDPVDGSFSISVRIPVLPINNLALLDLYLVYTKAEYVPKFQPILNRDRTVKSDLSTVQIKSIDAEVERIKLQFQNASTDVLQKAKSVGLDWVEIALIQRKKGILRITKIIKKTLFPLLLGLLIEFGITSLLQKNQKTCPTPDKLKSVTRRRNRVVRQLNTIYKGIGANTAIAGAALILAAALKKGYITIQGLPIPQAFGTPPSKDFGGLIFAQKTSLQSRLENTVNLLKDLEKQNKELNKQLLVALLFAVAATLSVLALLKAIDGLTEECSPNTVEGAEELSRELLDLSEEQTEEQEPPIESLNGFFFSVETEKNSVGELKRRFAVAKNKQGVTLLKGEPSFSSIDQVLIDELIFYIEQNNLKAN